MINTDSITPLYLQVKEHISSDIQNDKYQPSGKLPSEKELAAMYDVSIITIRRAVNELVDEQVVQKKQGKGTFVKKRSFSRTFSPNAISFTEICRYNDMVPGAKLLYCGVDPSPDPAILEKLLLPAGSKVICIRRLRFANDIPIVIETACFPMDWVFLLTANLENSSLYDVIHANKVVDLRPVAGQRSIKIAKASSTVAKYLNIREGTPVVHYVGLCWDALTDKPVHTSEHIGYGESMDFAFYF